jgi:hypothetical protein
MSVLQSAASGGSARLQNRKRGAKPSASNSGFSFRGRGGGVDRARTTDLLAGLTIEFREPASFVIFHDTLQFTESILPMDYAARSILIGFDLAIVIYTINLGLSKSTKTRFVNCPYRQRDEIDGIPNLYLHTAKVYGCIVHCPQVN